jgi:hypothetical protein
MYVFRGKMSLMHMVFTLFLLAVSCAFFTIKPAFGFGDEFSEDDIYVEWVVIKSTANEAHMFLLSYPDPNLYNPPYKEMMEGVLKLFDDNGLTRADKYADKENSWTKLFFGGTNQIPGESGFSMSIATKGDTGGLSPALGLGRYFYLTRENLGNKTFSDLVELAESMTPNAENRVMPNPSDLSSIGLGIRCRYPDGKERDITDIITIELELNEKNDGKIKLVYGCYLVDREVTNNEGAMLDDTQNYVSDGKADSKLEATWWITTANTNSDGSGSGGCNSGLAALAFICLPVSMLVRARRKLI